MFKSILLFIALIIIFIIVTGCSSNNLGSMVIPNETENSALETPDIDYTAINRIFWGAWDVVFDLDAGIATIIPERDIFMHFNVTPYIPSPGIKFNSYNPVTSVVDVDVTLENPFPINGYDVRLIIYNNTGHKLLNFDDWTALYDMPGGLPINPFKAYAKNEPYRRFGGLIKFTENLRIFLPGGNPSVKFAVDASYPSNCQEPWEISNFIHDTLGNDIGSTAMATVNVMDWGNNTDSVLLYCPQICGPTLVSFYEFVPFVWEATITNNTGTSGGNYKGYIIASSSDDGSLCLYDEVIITVIGGENFPPVCDGIGTIPDSGIIKWYESITISVTAHDPDGDLLTYEWDLDWDGFESNFNVDAIGNTIVDHHWSDQGFYLVGCRVTDDGIPPLSTFCSRLLIQEGQSNDAMKIDDSDEEDPNLMHPDTLILGEANGKPIAHAAYMDKDDYFVYYCNNNTGNPHIFGNHTVISTGPLNGSNYGVKIIGAEQTIFVFWLEYDTADWPPVCRVNFKRSDNLGESFGDTVTAVFVPDPNLITDADMCLLQDTEHLALFYIFRTPTPYYYCYLILSEDGGQSWDYPPFGSGQFRDVSFWEASNPHIAYSVNNPVIHVFWRDFRNSLSDYYYDYTTDGGNNWHTDVQITDNEEIDDAAMAVTSDGNAYFVWVDNAYVSSYFRKTQFGDPPILYPINTHLALGTGTYYAIDIWTSPSGDTVVVPMTYFYSGEYKNRIYYSYDAGDTMTDYFERVFGDNIVSDINSSVITLASPERHMIFNSWIDERIAFEQDAHIYGDFAFIAEW